jgi:DNA-binding transcriptional ArsR family regulator
LPAQRRTPKGRRKGKGRAKASSKAKSNRGVNQDLVKSLAHELRAEILAILNERMASPNELAKELGEGLSQVSYHVKVLRDYKVITLVKTEPRRGAVEHYYRATSRAFLTGRDWQALPESARVGMSADLLQAVIDDAVAAMEGGTFDDRKDRHFSWTPLMLDEKAWASLQKLLDDTLKQATKINEEAAKRLAKSKGQGISASVAMLGYEVPDSAAKKPAKRKARASGKKARGKAKAKRR